MRRLTILLLFVAFSAGSLVVYGTNGKETKEPETNIVEKVAVPENYQLYAQLGLAGLVDYKAFDEAMVGYKKIDNRKKDILTLIDFTKPSSEERMFVIDMKAHKLLLSTYVAHGRGSGDKYATKFSNKNGSSQSSLGFYVTDETYIGRNGYSLRLNGLEKGINDQARARGVVIHGADYCDPSFIESAGRLGRSLGCPAVPEDVKDDLINVVKGGALVYIYANDKNYISQSKILSKDSLNLVS